MVARLQQGAAAAVSGLFEQPRRDRPFSAKCSSSAAATSSFMDHQIGACHCWSHLMDLVVSGRNYVKKLGDKRTRSNLSRFLCRKKQDSWSSVFLFSRKSVFRLTFMSSKNRRTTAFGFSSGKFLENRASVFPKMRNTKNRKTRKTQKNSKSDFSFEKYCTFHPCFVIL